MVNWKELSDKWSELSKDTQDKIIVAMRQKYAENPTKFMEWLKEDLGRQIIWANYAVPPSERAPAAPPPPTGPRFKPGDRVVDRKTGDEYTIRNIVNWPSVLLEGRYGDLTARDESQLVTPEKYEALKGEERVAREARRAPVPIPGVAPGRLSSEDMKRLFDLYNNEFFRALGKVPPSSAATFRVEFERVKDKTFDEAKEAILALANEIIEELRARETVKGAVPIRPRPPRVLPPEVPGEERIPVLPGRAPPAQFPSFPLCYNLPFPRGPCSQERDPLWRAFRYQMQEQGYDASEYQREFEEYIMLTQFLSWEDLREKMNFFERTIMSGQQLPPLEQWRGLPIPTGLKGIIQEKPELEKLEDLIVHFSSVVIRNARSQGDIPTLKNLLDELAERAIITADTPLEELRDAAKTAITRAVERNDVWMSGITAIEINDFLAS